MPAFRYGNMTKKAQGAVTLADLYDQLVRDPALSFHARSGLMSKLESEAAAKGLSRNTTVTSVTGGVIGYLVSKYFKAGGASSLLAAGAGALAGRMFGARPQPSPIAGFDLI